MKLELGLLGRPKRDGPYYSRTVLRRRASDHAWQHVGAERVTGQYVAQMHVFELGMQDVERGPENHHNGDAGPPDSCGSRRMNPVGRADGVVAPCRPARRGEASYMWDEHRGCSRAGSHPRRTLISTGTGRNSGAGSHGVYYAAPGDNSALSSSPVRVSCSSSLCAPASSLVRCSSRMALARSNALSTSSRTAQSISRAVSSL